MEEFPREESLASGQLRCQAVRRHQKTGILYQCPRGRSDLNLDPHTICGYCRRMLHGRDCSPDSRCQECLRWPLWQFKVAKSKSSYRQRKG